MESRGDDTGPRGRPVKDGVYAGEGEGRRATLQFCGGVYVCDDLDGSGRRV